jgi:hypothetical protein
MTRLFGSLIPGPASGTLVGGKGWPGGGAMRKRAVQLALLGLMAVCFGALGGSGARAAISGSLGDGLPHAPLATPVRMWKDCQEIAQCTGCRPVYKCRFCTYQRQCIRGLCQWGNVCVWSPAMKVLPRGARIIQQ